MHIADYFARRKYNKKERTSQEKEEYQSRDVKQCLTCGDRFDSSTALKNHNKQKHSSLGL
jgi:hypothetical protein